MDKINNKKILVKEIKSKVTLKKIFYYIMKRKTLNIIRYNKNIQEVLNVTLKDYIENQQIEIEIFPYSMKKRQSVKKFINLPTIEDESLCHIYFNNDKKEIKRDYLNKGEKVSKIKVLLDYKFNSFSRLFEGCKIIRAINFKKFDQRFIYDMSYMFYKCTYLQKLDLSEVKTNSVTNMAKMFGDCVNLVSLNLSSFDTTHVTSMKDMFQGCISLYDLNLSSFNIQNVEDMTNMFSDCPESLKEVIKYKYRKFKNILS